MTYGPVERDVSKKDPSALPALLAQYNLETIPTLRQLRKILGALVSDIDDGAVTFGGVVFRVVTGPPVDPDPDGSFAFRVDGGAGTTLYHREAGIWVGRA